MGDIFTDGAVTQVPECNRYARGGWSAVTFEPCGPGWVVKGALWGTLEEEQTVPRAELNAILEALRQNGK